MIVNKSRAQWCASLTKIPIRIEDIEKIPLVTEEIKSMLKRYPKVFLGKDSPYCYLSRIEYSFAELTLGCNLRSMVSSHLQLFVWMEVKDMSTLLFEQLENSRISTTSTTYIFLWKISFKFLYFLFYKID